MTQQIRDLEVVGKDIIGAEFPNIITSLNTAEEFAAGKTWGRVLRLRRGGSAVFFDIGLDAAGNLFINTKNNTASTHVLTISPDGDVTIAGNLNVTGTLTTPQTAGTTQPAGVLPTTEGYYMDEIWLETRTPQGFLDTLRLFDQLETGTFPYPPGVSKVAGPWFSNEEAKILVLLKMADPNTTFVPFGLTLGLGMVTRRKLAPVVDWSQVKLLIKQLEARLPTTEPAAFGEEEEKVTPVAPWA